MKKIAKLACGMLTLFIAVPDSLHAQNGGYAVTERGADYAIHQKTTVEHGTNRIHRYIQLETGLNYTNSYGQLVESKEEIDVLPQGGAEAVQGRHKAYFPGDIYSGQIEVVTPDGLHLKSRPLGLSYFDGTNSVLIAELTNSIGVLVSSNQVIYPNAFTDFSADLRYTYTKAGFEQDVVLKEQPPSPETFGLDSKYTRLQLLTEFFDTADPAQTAKPVSQRDGLRDTTLTFGKMRKMKMMQGKAFSIGDQESARARGIPVYKSWLHLQGRTFLVEELPVATIAAQLDQLPLTARNEKPETGNLKSAASGFRSQGSRLAFAPSLATRHFELPPLRVAQANTVQLAKADMNYKSAVVLDYDEIDSDQTDFTFASDTTYFISGIVNLGGVATIQGGAVFKFPEDSSGGLACYTNIVCPADLDHPAIFTSMNDDSVGEIIDGSSGSPGIGGSSEAYLNVCSWDSEAGAYDVDDVQLSNLCLDYASMAIFADGANVDIWNCQFNDCAVCIIYQKESTPIAMGLHNVLFGNCPTGFIFWADWDDDTPTVSIMAENLTAVVDNFVYAGCAYGPDDSLSLTNCIIGTHTPYSEYGGAMACLTYYGAISTEAVHFIGDENVFETGPSSYQDTIGINDYHLTNGSPYRDVGTTGIDPDLLAEIQTMTTYAPQDGGFADTNTPDLGYHYSVNEDSDNDGLPDQWEWKYFGNYTHSGGDYDTGGVNTLAHDYANSLDPNVIQFTIESTNDYVNHTNVSLHVNITAGVASYYAVLVNSTNFSSATWNAYTSSNLTVNLGTTDGIYDVWVGMHDSFSDVQQTWNVYSFTLDRIAPVVTITNPIVSTVSVPMIELQGFANENLGSLMFDVNNAAGIFTNQTGYTTGQFYDTNRLAITTNYFQCYDVQLTNGLNTITVHALDLAGNETTNCVGITVDYSGDTTPPALILNWPTNGVSISGDSFTLQAQLDDYTATVTASIVNTNGETNTIQGLIERNSLVWVSMPLDSGTNTVTLTVTDGAGNTTVTNFTVTGNDAGLTMTPLTDDQLNQSSVDVSGTVGDASYSVTVNGVAATVSGDPTWSASGVPVSATGTASFYVEVKDSSGNLVTTHTYTQPQSAKVQLMGYFYKEDSIPTTHHYKVDWTYFSGGKYQLFPGEAGSYPSGDEGADEINDDFVDSWNGAWGWSHVTFRIGENIDVGADVGIDTHLMIEPSGKTALATMKSYIVRAQAWRTDVWGHEWLLDPQTVQIRGVALTPDPADGSWGEMLVTAQAGAMPEVTPRAPFQDYGFDVQLVYTKDDWTQVMQNEIDSESPVTIENYKAGNSFKSNRQNLKATYAFYQKVYLEQPTEYYWAGLADLAGADVYAGLSDAEYVRVGLVTSGILTLDTIGGTIVFEILAYKTAQFQSDLTQMNINILSDLGWQFEAYRKGGLNALEEINAVTHNTAILDIAPWREIDQGIQQNSQALVLQGNRDLLEREQKQILPDGYAKINSLGTRLMTIFAECPVSDPSTSQPYVGHDFESVVGSGHNIANTDDRWTWITTSTTGIWDTWVNLSLTDKTNEVSTSLATRALTYSLYPSRPLY